MKKATAWPCWGWRKQPIDIQDWLKHTLERLGGKIDQPMLAAQVLLASVINKPRTWLAAHPELEINSPQLEQLDMYLARILSGEPLPYVLGAWEFYGLSFHVTPHVLIPRPETELLVDEAIQWLHTHPGKRSVADVGAGSGCIAVSLAKYFPDLKVIATDVSFPALRVARENASLHQTAQQIRLVNCDLLRPIQDRFNLVCANLPYIPTQRLPELQVARHEPRLALDGGSQGMNLIRSLLLDAPRSIAPGGLILLEIDFTQENTLASFAEEIFPNAGIQVLKDYSGLPRLLMINLAVHP